MAPATSYMSGNCDGKCKNIKRRLYLRLGSKILKQNSSELIHQSELNATSPIHIPNENQALVIKNPRPCEYD